ncbi:MAG: hypothetical protein IJ115_04235 [Erysipelotrichaceae bacterium]|nr:hypothetical protein [Erysipelotrichaceae bacterium]
MRYAFKQFVITPLKPVKQAGHIQQVDPVSEVHDDLHARIAILDDGTQIYVHVSCDLLGIRYDFEKEVAARVADKFDKPFNLTVSCTHTHYAGDTTNEEYYNQLLEQIPEFIKSMELTETDKISVSYNVVPFDQLGRSRISHYTATVLLGLIRLYDGNDKEIAQFTFHNVHPTVLSASETHFFSAEWPGYVLKTLSDKHPGIFFTYLQGCSGDISTRFTRDGQNYEAIVKLGDKLVNKIEELRNEPVEKKPLKLDYAEEMIKCEHEFNEINFDEIPDYATPRELETIGYGKIVRARLKDQPEKWTKQVLISKISLGPVTLVFSPNELFSKYLTYVDLSKALVVCYSNGYSPYVTPIDEKLLTYETFTDTLTKETKQKIIDVIKKFGNN